MPRVELLPYHKDLAEILKSEGNPEFRKNFLESERLTPQYKNAKEAAKRRNLALREISRQDLINAEDESSQALPVVGNPLVDLKPAERELALQEQTILWANQVLEEYNGLPKRNSREKKVATNLATQAARRLLQNPEDIDIAGSIWKSHESKEQAQDEKQKQNVESFYDLVTQEASRDIRKNWEKVSPEQLSQMIKTYANNFLVQDLAQEILVGYSKGPTKRSERAEYFYNVARAAIRLVEDKKAFVEAMRIQLFHNEDVLPRRRNLLERGKIVTIPWDVGEKELEKWLRLDHITIQLSYVYPEELRPLVEENNNFLRGHEAREFAEKEGERAVGKIGYEETLGLSQKMTEYSRRAGLRMYEDGKIDNLPWPESIINDRDDPLMNEYSDSVLEKVHFEQAKQFVVEAMQDGDNQEKEKIGIVHFVLPNGLIADVFVPDKLISNRKEIVELISDRNYLEGIERKIQDSTSEDSMKSFSLYTAIRFVDSVIIVNFRKASGFERNQHPLQSLETIGFPNPTTEGVKDIGLANIDLAEEIRRSQIRFLNKRGVRVPVKNTPLGDFGYSHIDFQKDSDDLSKTVVKVFVGDVPYSVKLDQYFNFDFEGKKFNAPFIQDALRYTILSYLKPILCDDRVINAKGEERDLDAEVVSRMGHLMLLPSDRHRSVRAIVNCFRVEAKDLIALDAERREMRRKAGNRVPEDREYTYRRPVIEKEENLPPIIINLPGVLKFGNT